MQSRFHSVSSLLEETPLSVKIRLLKSKRESKIKTPEASESKSPPEAPLAQHNLTPLDRKLSKLTEAWDKAEQEAYQKALMLAAYGPESFVTPLDERWEPSRDRPWDPIHHDFER